MQLASGRFAIIDNGLGFELVPWKPALEEQLGRQVSGVVLLVAASFRASDVNVS